MPSRSTPSKLSLALWASVTLSPSAGLSQSDPVSVLAEAPRTAIEQSFAGLMTCSKERGSEDRLACFDAAVADSMDAMPDLKRLFGEGEPSVEEDAEDVPTDPGKWRLSRSTNPIDDSPTVVLQLTAESGRNEYGKPIRLVARCQSNTTEVYIDWDTYVGDDSSSVYNEWKRVTLRIGESEAETQRWGTSTDKKATFAPDWAGALLKTMLTSDRMVVQLTPYGANPITAVFETKGLDAVLPELAETCNWSY